MQNNKNNNNNNKTYERKQTRQVFAQAKEITKSKIKISSSHKHNNKHKEAKEQSFCCCIFACKIRFSLLNLSVNA